MAISFVGGTSLSATATSYNVSLTGLTGGSNSSPSRGDLIVVFTGWADTVNADPGVTSPAVTEVADLYANSTYDANLSAAYFFAGATPPTSITVRGLATNGVTSVLVFRGVDRATPIDVTTTTFTATADIDSNPPAITPATTGACVVVGGLCAYSTSGASGSQTYTAPASYTLGAQVAQTAGLRATACSGAYRFNLTGGVSENPGFLNFGVTALNASSCSVTMALRPASGSIKTWNGTLWLASPVKYWNGSAWVTKPLKRWNGSAWVTTTY